MDPVQNRIQLLFQSLMLFQRDEVQGEKAKRRVKRKGKEKAKEENLGEAEDLKKAIAFKLSVINRFPFCFCVLVILNNRAEINRFVK